jgi:hypothetical protein
MALRYKASSCWVDSKQLTQQQTLDVDQTANSEEVVIDSPEIGYTAGRPASKISIKGATPVSGIDVDLQTMFAEQRQFKFAAFINGKIFTWTGARLTSLKWNSDQGKGSANFDAEIGAGLPTVS